jgi:carboxylesterase
MHLLWIILLIISLIFIITIAFLFFDESLNVPVSEIRLEGTNGKTIFIITGLTGTPNPYRESAARLNADGYSVYVPLLKNHGGKLSAIKNTSLSEIKAQLKSQIKNVSGDIIIIGECSGALLALDLAGELHMPAALINIPLDAPLGFAYLPLPYFYRFDFGLLKNNSMLHEVLRYHKYPIPLLREQLRYRKTLNLNLTESILIIQSKGDIRAPQSGAFRLHNLAKNSELFLLNNSGHLPYLDVEKEIFYAKLKEFLNKQ